jgi:hypothetical protein
MSVNKTILNFIIERDLLERIEDFRFKNRFPTRAAAIKWLLAWAVKQKPSPKALSLEREELPKREEPPKLVVPEAAIHHDPAPPKGGLQVSRESAIQALNDQGYEVGETAQHPDGILRIAVRSKDASAWVNVDQELADLAAGRITLREVASRGAAGS